MHCFVFLLVVVLLVLYLFGVCTVFLVVRMDLCFCFFADLNMVW
jgi:hypothetical protein